MKQKLPLSVFPSPVAFNISFAPAALPKAGDTQEPEQGANNVISSLYMCVWMYMWLLVCVCVCLYM